MMTRFIFFILLLSSSLISAEPNNFNDDPLIELKDLILSTENLVIRQKTLLQEVSTYLTLRTEAVKDLDNPANKELLLKTAKAAQNALEIIKSEHLSHLFTSPFLSEMTLFAKLSGRPRIPQ